MLQISLDFLLRIKAPWENMLLYLIQFISFNELVARSQPLFLKEMPARIKFDMLSFIKNHIDIGGDWNAAFFVQLLSGSLRNH